MMRTLLPCFFVIAVGTAAPFAHAQPAPAKSATPPIAPSATVADEARKLFEEGTAELNAGRYAEAAVKLRAAWAKKKSYDVAGNLGTALIQLGKDAEAAKLLSYAVSNFPAGGSPKEKKWVEETFAAVRKSVVMVRVRVTVEGADVFVNGEAIGKSPVTDDTYAMPGVIVVVANKEGFEDARLELKGDKGGDVDAALTMKAKGTPPVVTEWPRWPAFVGAGVAAVAVGAGVGFAVSAGDNAGAADKKLAEIRKTSGAGPCPETPATGACRDLADLNRAHDQMRNVSAGFFIGAGILALGTAGYAVWATRTPVQATVGVGPRGAAFVVQGSF